jgi:hypothetical protein
MQREPHFHLCVVGSLTDIQGNKVHQRLGHGAHSKEIRTMRDKQIPSSRLLTVLQDIAGPLPTETAPTPNLSQAALAQVTGGTYYITESGWSGGGGLRPGH